VDPRDFCGEFCRYFLPCRPVTQEPLDRIPRWNVLGVGGLSDHAQDSPGTGGDGRERLEFRCNQLNGLLDDRVKRRTATGAFERLGRLDRGRPIEAAGESRSALVLPLVSDAEHRLAVDHNLKGAPAHGRFPPL